MTTHKPGDPDQGIPADIKAWRRRDAVLYLSRQTGDAEVIAALLDTSTRCVRTVMSNLRAAGYPIPAQRRRPGGHGSLEVVSTFPSAIADILHRAAADRGESAISLTRRIITTVLNNDLVDAVLDDAGR